MIKKLLFLIASGCLLSLPRLSAQSNSYSHGHEVKKEDVNMMELSEYEKLHPPAFVQKPVINEEGEEIASRRVILANPALVRTIHGEVMNLSDAAVRSRMINTDGTHTAYMPASSPPADTFQAQATDGTSIPPDTHGAVDGTYAIAALNSSVRIRNKTTHASVSNVSLNSFWGSALLGSGGGAFDPRIHYDAYTNRWIMVAVSVNGSMTNSEILIAITATGDPTGTWHKYAIATDASGATWLDFPNVGYNSKWVTVTGNYFSNSSGGFTNSVIYVFDKAAIAAGTGAPFTRIGLTGSGGFTLCPATTLDATEGSMFIMDVTNPAAGQLRLRKLTGAVASPVLSGTIFNPATTTHWNNSPGVDFGPQSGTTNKLQVNDDRINNLTFRNGKLWCSHNIYLPASGSANRSAIMWWQTDTAAAGGVIQNGVLDGGSSALMFAFPNISVNQNNDALMGFAYMSSGLHPSAAYAYRLSSDTTSKMQTPFIYRHGQSTYYQTFGGSDNRWGDYSATCVDPNNVDFWTLQESVPSTNNWDTWWAKVIMCNYLVAPTGGTGPAAPCAGTVATYAVSPVTGATGYTWTIPTGSGWSGTSTTNSLDLTIGTGTVTVTVAANNVCGPGSVYTFTISAMSAPTVTATASSGVCIGAATATFTTTATGGMPTSYNWTVSGAGWSGSSTTSSLTTTVGGGTGTITVNGTNACGTGPDFVYTITPTAPPGAASNILGPSTPCSGTTATYTTPAVSGASSYTWTVSGFGWSGTSTTGSITVTVGTGTGTITVTPVSSCGNGLPFTITPIANTAPTALFNASTHITPTHTIVTFDFIGAAPSGTTYLWTFAGGTPSSSTSAGPINVQWISAGTYSVTLVTTNGGCTASRADTIHVNASTETQLVNIPSAEVSIMPNPSRGEFELIFSQPVSGAVTIKMYDMEGRVVYYTESASIVNNRMPVATQSLASGNYNAVITADGAVISKKITITR